MDPKHVHVSTLTNMYMMMMIMSLLVGLGSSDLAKDKEECVDQLVGLATCLPYVGGEAKAPPPDCCTGLKLVLQKSKKCLCVLVRDMNDPNLGFKIDANLALGLPVVCHTSNFNVSECPTLLHLPANSPDAKIFEDFVSGSKGNSTTPPAATGQVGSTTDAAKSDGGGRGKILSGVELAWGVLVTVFLYNWFT